jgi:hypothetical protein
LNGVIFTEVNSYIIEPDRQFKRYFSLLPKVWYAASLTYTFFYSSLHPFYFFLVKTQLPTPKTLLWAYHTYKPWSSDIIVSFVTPHKSSSLNTKASNSYVNKIDNRQTVYKKLTQFKFIVFLYRRLPYRINKTTSKQELPWYFSRLNPSGLLFLIDCLVFWNIAEKIFKYRTDSECMELQRQLSY